MKYRQMFVIYEKQICIVSIFLDIKAKGFLCDSMLDHIFGDIRFCGNSAAQNRSSVHGRQIPQMTNAQILWMTNPQIQM